MKKIFLVSLLLFSFAAFPQGGNISGGGGNGGDYLRMKFIEVGNFILQNYKDGLKDIEPLTTLEDLRNTLDINVIQVSKNELTDNRGNKVDALGKPGSIILYEAGWQKIFSNADLVEKIVLHEMLRAVGVNDDNYVYSTIVLKKYDLSHFDRDEYIRWCSESASFIESALKQGILAKTHEQEIQIYKKTLEQVEALISPKHFYFVGPSVNGALKITSLFKTDIKRVNFLRLALTQIASDIKYVNSLIKKNNSASVKNLGDHASHALSYVKSAFRFTILAETHEIELQILNIVFDQVYAYMVNSDYARTKYGALFSELDSARNSPILSYKRQALTYIAELLK